MSRSAEWEAKNPDKAREHQKRYASKHAEKIAEYQKRYTEENRERLNEYRRQWKAKKRAEDPSYRAKDAEYRATHKEEAKAYRAARKGSGKGEDPTRVEYRRMLRKEIMWAAKDRPCMDCKGEYDRRHLHFHHRDPSTKLFNIALAQSRSIESLVAEIAKCDVLCTSCHRIRHVKGGAALAGSTELRTGAGA